jgi:hypothetical protein
MFYLFHSLNLEQNHSALALELNTTLVHATNKVVFVSTCYVYVLMFLIHTLLYPSQLVRMCP